METPVPRGVEADTFFAFNNLMSETKDLFIQQMDDCTTGLFDRGGRFTLDAPCWSSCTHISSGTCRRPRRSWWVVGGFRQ